MDSSGVSCSFTGLPALLDKIAHNGSREAIMLFFRPNVAPKASGGSTITESTLIPSISANESAVGEDDSPEQEFSSLAMAGLLAVSITLGIVVFFLIPVFVSRLVENVGANNFVANVVEGGIRFGLFIAYVWLIGRMDDIKRVFGYHGAEHMVVHAHEAGEPLTIDSVRRFPPAHPRCGTSFLMTVVLVSIIMFMFFPRDPFWVLLVSRIVLIPIIAGISYEFIRYAGTHQDNVLVRVSGYPNILLQDLTTRQPDNDMMEVAIVAIEYAMALDEHRAVPSDNASQLSTDPFEPVNGIPVTESEFDSKVKTSDT